MNCILIKIRLQNKNLVIHVYCSSYAVDLRAQSNEEHVVPFAVPSVVEGAERSYIRMLFYVTDVSGQKNCIKQPVRPVTYPAERCYHRDFTCAETPAPQRINNEAENESDDKEMDFLDTNHESECLLPNSELLLPVY